MKTSSAAHGINLEDLINEINDEMDQSEKYYTEDDCNHYTDALYEGEWEINADWDEELDDDIKEDIAKLNLSEDELKQLLIETSGLVFISEFWLWRREVASVSLGEIEIELSQEIIEKLELLSDDEIERVEKETYNYMSGSYTCLNLDSCRWALRYDEDLLALAVNDLANSIDPVESELKRIKRHHRDIGLRLCK